MTTTPLEAEAREAAKEWVAGIPRVLGMGGALSACEIAFDAGYKQGHASRARELAEAKERIAGLRELLSESTLYLDGTYANQAALELKIVMALDKIPLPTQGSAGEEEA